MEINENIKNQALFLQELKYKGVSDHEMIEALFQNQVPVGIAIFALMRVWSLTRLETSNKITESGFYQKEIDLFNEISDGFIEQLVKTDLD